MERRDENQAESKVEAHPLLELYVSSDGGIYVSGLGVCAIREELGDPSCQWVGNEEECEVGNVVAKTGILRIGIVLRLSSKSQRGVARSVEGNTHDKSARDPSWGQKVGICRVDGMAFCDCRPSVSFPGSSSGGLSLWPTLTLRGIRHGNKHQRNERYEEQVVDEELGRAPEWRWRDLGNGTGAGIFGGGGSRVGSSSGRGGCGGGEASVEGVERIDPARPGEEGGHFTAVAWRRVRGRKERERERSEVEVVFTQGAEAHQLAGPEPITSSLDLYTMCFTLSTYFLFSFCISAMNLLK